MTKTYNTDANHVLNLKEKAINQKTNGLKLI